MKSYRPVALVTLTVLMIVWGSTFLVTKESVREIPPFTLAAVRYLIASIVLGGIALGRNGRSLFHLPMSVRQLLNLSISGVALFIVALNYALLWGSVTQAALIYALTPAAVAIAAVVALRERLSPLRIVGILLSIAGVLLVIATGKPSPTSPHPLWAAVAMLIVVAGWAAYTVTAKQLASRDQLVVAAWVVAAGSVMLLPLAAWEVARVGWPTVSVRGWVGVLFLGIVASGLAYVVYNWTLRHLEASVVGALSNLDPIVGVLSAVIFLGEIMGPLQVVGGIAALGGMTMATLQGNKGRQRETRASG